MASLLYYFGILTQGSVTPFGELMLTIPNLVIRRLHAEAIREMLLPEGKDADMAERAARSLPDLGVRRGGKRDRDQNPCRFEANSER